MWLVSLSLWAQSARAEPSLSDYMEAAVRNSPRSALAAAQIDAAHSAVTTAGGALLPTVSGAMAYTRNQYEAIAVFPDPEGGPPQELIIVPSDQLQATLRVRVPLIDAPALARWRSAKSGVDAAQQREQEGFALLRIDVARAWYAAIAAGEVIAAAERSKGAAEESLRYLSLRAEAGAATLLSVKRAELEVANAELLVIDARRASQIARRQLATLSGLPEPVSLPKTPLPDEDISTETTLTEAELQIAASRARPELAAARADSERQERVVQGAWLAYTPTVAAVGTEQLTNATGFTGQSGVWTLGLELDWQLLDFGARSGSLKAARAALAAAEATVHEAEQDIRDEVYAALLDLETARARVSVARNGSAVALAAASESQLRFQAGTATQVEVITAERDALQAEVQRIEAEGEFALSRLVLQQVTGEPIR